ncbi:MAG: D-alanyl-D-alanine carboxypeptidase [Duodenibacillus sp.]|nr:D-alanyl-D-alanine carboxypeptidase [Duodenibacillus sp.]
MKKHGLTTLAFTLALCGSISAYSAEKSSSFLVMDCITGTPLVQQNQFDIVNPSDHIRLMTLLTAFDLMRAKDLTGNESVAIYHHDVKDARSEQSIGLKEGDRIPLNDLLRAVAITGAQDASLAVASFLGATRHDFVDAMNRTAGRSGMQRSSFTSPIADVDQQSCAYDLALLTKELQTQYSDRLNWFFEKSFVFKSKTYKNTNRSIQSNTIKNDYFVSKSSNDVILSYKDTDATRQVQRCFISVVLTEPKTAFNSAMNLLRNAVVDFNIVKLYSPNQAIASVKLINGSQDTITVGSPSSVYISLHKNQISKDLVNHLQARVEYAGPVSAPIKHGQPVGELIIELDKVLIGRFPVVSLETIELGHLSDRLKSAVQH